MGPSVRNIIFLGAGGQAGRPVFNALLKECQSSELVVSVLTRTGSNATFPQHVTVLRTDYTLASLEQVLRGQDVIISMLGDDAFTLQKTIVEAAIKVGVRRIFPSEFGCKTSDQAVVDLMPYFWPKKALIEWLRTQESSISWTVLSNGPFFDEALKNTFHGYAPPNDFYILDGGDTPYSTTNLHTIGLALFKILSDPSHFADSANRYVNIHSHIATQLEVLAALEKATGTTFNRHHLTSDTFYDDSLSRFLSRGPGEPKDMKNLIGERDIIQCITYGKGRFQGMGDNRGENDWTERLELPKEDLLDDVRAVLAGTRPEREYKP